MTEQLDKLALAKNTLPSNEGVAHRNNDASGALRAGIGVEKPSKYEIAVPEGKYANSGNNKILNEKVGGMSASITGKSILLGNRMTGEGDNPDLIINLDTNGNITEDYNIQGNRGHIDEKTLTTIVEDLRKQGINVQRKINK